METKDLVLLLTDYEGQQALYTKAKSEQGQAMIDFVRFSVLKKVYDSKEIAEKDKLATFESFMKLVNLESAITKGF